MIKKIPTAGKSISGNSSFASWVETEVRVISVAMESMCLTLVAEEASVGREVQVLSSTSSHLTSIWLQVRIQVFAGLQSVNDLGKSIFKTLTGKHISGLWAYGCKGSLQWQKGSSIFHRSGSTTSSMDGPGEF